MKIYAVVADGGVIEVFNDLPFRTQAADGASVQHLPGALASYIAEGVLADKGVYELDLPEPPAGQVELERELYLADGVPAVNVTFGDPPPPPVPKEIPMHKAQKAMILTPWGDEGGNLYDAVVAGIAALPAPSNLLAKVEFDRALNLVRDGQTTLAVMQIIGMTPQQRDDLFLFADTLP